MLDDKTTEFIEKVAKQGSLGESQVKRKTVKKTERHGGSGAGLGAILGTAAGAASKKFKPLAMLAGGLGGALAGKQIGKKVKSKTKTTYDEGVIKRRETRDEPDKAKLPRLNASKAIESK
jgi:uncharacterized protein YcfJ